MSYDYTAARTALMRVSNVDGWADKKSAQLEREFLTPLQHNTLAAERLADDISAFILDIESKIQEITDHI